jgi:hypothetical protein
MLSIYSIIRMSFISILIIIGLAFLMQKAHKSVRIIKLLRNENVLFVFLIIWTIFGFFTQQDFIESCYGLNFSNIFTFDNILCSSLSFILLFLGLIINKKLIRISIVTLELAYWIFKLFALKSGYEFFGLDILICKYYDFIGLLARLLLLNALIKYRFKEYKLVLLCGLLLIVKMFTFPCSKNFIQRDFIVPYKNRLIFNKINGSWTGSMLYPNDSILVHTIKNPDTALYGNRPEINIFRDTFIFARFENVYFSFDDSSLTIEKTDPELNGNYYLTNSQPDYPFFVYIPVQYIDSVKRDNMFNQYSITVTFYNANDSVLYCLINNTIKVTLEKSR